jgi:AraC-like DNA-binding protein
MLTAGVEVVYRAVVVQDQANFTRAFRGVYGISPREYRRTR